MTRRSGLPRAVLLFAATPALAVGTSPAPAQSVDQGQPGEPATDIVVTGYPDIVVNGRAQRCRPAAGDPLDAVPIPGWMIVPDGDNGFVARQATEQVTGPDFWQRVGVGLGAYRFRSPRGGRPMCIGGPRGGNRFAGFRRIVDAGELRGHRVRFTAWIAMRKAEQVNFWIAAGSGRLVEGEPPVRDRLLNGGNTNGMPLSGSRGWTPVLLETGPIDDRAGHVSYGFNLEGGGDIWVYDPKLAIVADRSPDMPGDNLFMIGRNSD